MPMLIANMVCSMRRWRRDSEDLGLLSRRPRHSTFVSNAAPAEPTTDKIIMIAALVSTAVVVMGDVALLLGDSRLFSSWVAAGGGGAAMRPTGPSRKCFSLLIMCHVHTAPELSLLSGTVGVVQHSTLQERCVEACNLEPM